MLFLSLIFLKLKNFLSNGVSTLYVIFNICNRLSYSIFVEFQFP